MIDGGLRLLFRQNVRAHWQSVETGMTGRGIPDSNYCMQTPSGGIEGWVEFKLTSGWSVTLRPEQVGWHLARARAGGRTFIAVRRNNRPKRIDELWLCRGAFARELKTGGLRGAPPEAVLGAWPGPPARWPWPEVSAALGL